MSARSFRSVFMVASCAGAALGCYLVSLRVASERAALEDVETRIVMTQRDIRLLQTEIGTRGRLAQLERWNAKALRPVGAVGRPVPRGRLRARQAHPARAQCRHPGAGGAGLGSRSRAQAGARRRTERRRCRRFRPGARSCRTASPGQPENRDARGPGDRPTLLAAGKPDTAKPHGDQPAAAAKTGDRRNPWISRASRPPSP